MEEMQSFVVDVNSFLFTAPADADWEDVVAWASMYAQKEHAEIEAVHKW